MGKAAKMIRLTMLAVALTLATVETAMGAPADGFAVFWPSFAAAAAKDDTKALASMIVLGPALGDTGASFARFHATNLGPKARRCLAKAKPTRDVDPQGAVSYSAFCGEVIYSFSKVGGGWKLTDIGPND
jgi:hypothetical protein